MNGIMPRKICLAAISLCLLFVFAAIPAAVVHASGGWQTFSAPPGGLNLLDVAVSANYEQDQLLYVLGWDDLFILWRCQNGVWTEVLRSGGDIDSLDKILLAPDGSLLVYGWQAGVPALWHAAGAAAFSVCDMPFPLDCWQVAPDGTLYLAGYDGFQAGVCYTTDYGASYSTAVGAGEQPLSSLAVSPDFARDGTLMAGNISGGVYCSQNRGGSFSRLVAPMSGSVSLAFGPDYAGSRLVYAAGDSAGSGFYSLDMRTQLWQRLDDGRVAGAMLGSVAAAPGGVAYACNYQAVDAASQQGGMLRCLPAAGGCEVVLDGLLQGATLWRLWRSGERLWAMDTTYNLLYFYDDYPGQPVTLKSPADGAMRIGVPAAGNRIKDITLAWEPLAGVDGYQWQVCTDSSFADIPTGQQGITSATSVPINSLEPFTIYYWRVRASSPASGPWSAVRLFLTAAYELAAPRLQYPLDAAQGMPLRPDFRWSEVPGATAYEVEIAAQPDFINPAARKTTSALGWQPGANLGYGTVYYWRVRASVPAPGPWSEVWSFSVLEDTLGIPLLQSPPAGASAVPLRPLLVWSAVARATSYEVMVSLQPDFGVLALYKKLGQNSWQAEAELQPQTTYYWRVRALKTGVEGEWSPAGYFRTTGITTAAVITTVGSSTPPDIPPAPVLPSATPAATSEASAAAPIATAATTSIAAAVTLTTLVTAASGMAEWGYYLFIAVAALLIWLLLLVLWVFTRRRSPYA
jgi:hypothetical protein